MKEEITSPEFSFSLSRKKFTRTLFVALCGRYIFKNFLFCFPLYVVKLFKKINAHSTNFPQPLPSIQLLQHHPALDHVHQVNSALRTTAEVFVIADLNTLECPVDLDHIALVSFHLCFV